MLSDERRKIIEAEEQFRHELRASFEDIASRIAAESRDAKEDLKVEIKAIEKSLGAKVMEFLNSAVGMWLLSSVVITGGAAVFQRLQHHYDVEEKNKTQLVLYQFEIGNRIQNMKYFLRQAKTVGDAKIALEGVFRSKFPLSPDLKDQNLSTLYFSLQQLAHGSTIEKNKKAMDVVRDLEDAEYLLQSQKNDAPLDAADKQRLEKLIAAIENLHIETSAK